MIINGDNNKMILLMKIDEKRYKIRGIILQIYSLK